MMMGSNVAELIRRCYAAYLARDQQTVADSFSEDFRFSSPRDDRLTKTEYFETCWEGGDQFVAFDIEQILVEGSEAFIRYQVELKDGSKFRNTEFMRTLEDQIVEVEVYFGRSDSADKGEEK
ncbi:MAG: nuclear transport factor 2 family protein [Pyrinomonadaceae bacterium]